MRTDWPFLSPEEIGMSYTAFRHFLKGGHPHPATRAKLAGWFAARRAGRRGAPPAGDVESAILIVQRYIDAGSTEKTRQLRFAEIVGRLGKTSEP